MSPITFFMFSATLNLNFISEKSINLQKIVKNRKKIPYTLETIVSYSFLEDLMVAGTDKYSKKVSTTREPVSGAELIFSQC